MPLLGWAHSKYWAGVAAPPATGSGERRRHLVTRGVHPPDRITRRIVGKRPRKVQD